MNGVNKAGRAVTGAFLAAIMTLAGPDSQAQESRRPSTIVVYGDTSRDWLADLAIFANLSDPRDRPVIVMGDSLASIPKDATLVWFGDLTHRVTETARVPTLLKAAANDLGRGVADRSVGLAKGEVRIGANCYTRHIDRPDGLPEIVVNFSGDDPQKFCKGLSISHLLVRHGQWIRNDGSPCAFRDCALIQLQRPEK